MNVLLDRYSPFGEIIFDSNPGLILHVGFRGEIYDPTTRLLHFHNRDVLTPQKRSEISSAEPLGVGGRSEEKSFRIFYGVDYDPRIAQFTSSAVKFIPLTGAGSFPMRLYQVNDAVNLSPYLDHMTDTRSWLNALGFKLQNVAPDPQIARRQKVERMKFCWLHDFNVFIISRTNRAPSANCHVTCQPTWTCRRQPPLYWSPDTPPPTSRQVCKRNLSVATYDVKLVYVAGGSMLAQGLIISIDRGSITAQVTDTATDDVKRYSSVVSGAEALIGRRADTSLAAMSQNHEGKPVLFLSKPASAFAKDKQTMQVADGRERTLRSAYGSGNDVTSSLISLRLHGNEMRAESGYALVIIYYVDDDSDVRVYDVQFTSAEQERDRVINDAKRRAENEAWLREKKKIQSGLRTRWSDSEKQEILSKGRLQRYTIEQTWNPEIYPEFSDSGRNVQFTKV